MKLKLATFAVLVALAQASAAQTVIDGKWKTVAKPGEQVFRMTYKTSGDRITLEMENGGGYTARLDGTEARTTEMAGMRSVSVTMPAPNVLQEIGKLDGKPVVSMRMEVDASGKRAKVVWRDLSTPPVIAPWGYDMVKQ